MADPYRPLAPPGVRSVVGPSVRDWRPPMEMPWPGLSQREWTPFAPALPFLLGLGIERALADIDHELGGIDLRFAKSPVALFAGLEDEHGDAGWNHTLFFCPRQSWPAFDDRVGRIGFRRGNWTGLVRGQKLQLRNPEPPWAPVTVESWVVKGSNGTMMYDVSGPLPCPEACTPSEEAKVVAAAIAASGNPVVALQDWHWSLRTCPGPPRPLRQDQDDRSDQREALEWQCRERMDHGS